MKKTVLIILLFVLCLPLFATQQMFYAHSTEVKTLKSLYREAGVTIPDYIYPVSADVLLDSIEASRLHEKLNGPALDSLTTLCKTFKGGDMRFKMSEKFSFDADVALSPYAYYFSQTEEEYTEKISLYNERYQKYVNYDKDGVRRDWVVPFNELKPLLSLGADLKMTDYLFGHFEYIYSRLLAYWHLENFVTSIPILGNNRERNQTVPYNLYFAGGTGTVSAVIGRFRVSSGDGETGNLSIGDNFMFRDTFKFTVNTLPFTYEFMINTFAPEGDYVEDNGETKSWNMNLNHTSELVGDGRPVVVVHKATLNVLDNLNVGLYEAIMDYVNTSAFDLRYLAPFALMHNWISYRYTTNNWFGFDVNWGFKPGWSMNAQVMFDQIQMSDEQSKGTPSAFGVLLNIKNTTRLQPQMVLNTYVEAAYTSPSMYLKTDDKDYYDNTDDYWKLDLITGNYHCWCSGEDTNYLGYAFGPNTIAFALGGELVTKNNTGRVNLLYRVNGDTGMYYTFDGDIGKSPSGEESHSAFSPYCFTEGHSPQHLIRIALSDTYTMFDGALELSGGIAYQHYINFKCETGVQSSDIQAQVGVTFHPIDLF